VQKQVISRPCKTPLPRTNTSICAWLVSTKSLKKRY
jgi:hypothetical protein